MNLLGSFSNNHLTLDKLNRLIRKLAHQNNIDVKIYQTHDEAKYVSILHRNRNKIDGMLLNLGPWNANSNIIHQTLSIINKPYRIVENSEKSKIYLKKTLFEKKLIIAKDDITKSYIDAMEQLIS
tara:strand:- start:9 stop:383 length:375 start_codon:yes stop_codon:yes gene_type:complete